MVAVDRITPPGSDQNALVTQPDISVIVPVRNGSEMLTACLKALWQSEGVRWECIVVDDGCTDQSMAIARLQGARLARTRRPGSGPGQARNIGVLKALAPLVCFIDADVVVTPTTLADFVELFRADPDLAAAFGSYDDDPLEPELLSQYRNLLHHFVHQTGREQASTFWSGCGTVRRDIFLEIGGFETHYGRPCIEDISLGYLLRQRGHAIRLAKHIQVKHLKRWTLWNLLKTDIRDRALPWTELIVRTRNLPNDLNLNGNSRLSALSVFTLVALIMASSYYPLISLLAVVPLLTLIVCNISLYSFFFRSRGAWFTIGALPFHWLYFAYSAVAFVSGVIIYSLLARLGRHNRQAQPPGLPAGQPSAGSQHPV